MCSDLSWLQSHLSWYSTSQIDDQLDGIAEEIEQQIGGVLTADEGATLVRLLQWLKPDYSPLSNNTVDPRGTAPSYADIAFGGDGWDILIANSAADTLIDWHNEGNVFYYPWEGDSDGVRVNEWNADDVPQFLLDLSLALGADPTRPDTAPFSPYTYPSTWEGQRDWQDWMSWAGWNGFPGWHGWGQDWWNWNGWNGWFGDEFCERRAVRRGRSLRRPRRRVLLVRLALRRLVRPVARPRSPAGAATARGTTTARRTAATITTIRSGTASTSGTGTAGTTRACTSTASRTPSARTRPARSACRSR